MISTIGISLLILSDMLDFEEYKRLHDLLVNTNTSLLTPHLGKGNHLFHNYLRFSFIAKVIEYLGHQSVFCQTEKIETTIICRAVCQTSISLNYLPTVDQLHALLYEMTVGLKLLTHSVVDSKTILLSLSEKGWEAYRNQEFQILAANLKSAMIGRFVSYIALFVSIIALVVAFFSNK